MPDLAMFVPIAKVDVQRREVWGVAAEEQPDKADEVFDYTGSRPHFEAWSKSFAAATGGKSLGNIRAMHGPMAAGKVISLNFDDVARRVLVGAKVVDDNEWVKVREGVYTGFSIGGKYVKRWTDPVNADLVRYIAKPSEISLVDNPCMPGAVFEVVKEDGTSEMRKFAEVEKVTSRDDASPKEGESKYGDVEFADAKNKKYPIDTAEHIRAAWNYINKAGNADKYSAEDVKAIKAKIVAAWKNKIDKDGPPSAEEKAMPSEMAKYAGEEIHDAAIALQCLDWLESLLVKEQEEGHPEAAEQTAQLKAAIAGLKAFVASEVQEPEPEPAAEGEAVPVAMAAPAGDVAKANYQAIHDDAVSKGAKCAKPPQQEEKSEKTAPAGDVAKVAPLPDPVTGPPPGEAVSNEGAQPGALAVSGDVIATKAVETPAASPDLDLLKFELSTLKAARESDATEATTLRKQVADLSATVAQYGKVVLEPGTPMVKGPDGKPTPFIPADGAAGVLPIPAERIAEIVKNAHGDATVIDRDLRLEVAKLQVMNAFMPR